MAQREIASSGVFRLVRIFSVAAEEVLLVMFEGLTFQKLALLCEIIRLDAKFLSNKNELRKAEYNMNTGRVCNRVVCVVAVALTVTFNVSAAQPSESSVKELLMLSGSAQGIEMMKGQFSAFQVGAVQEALKGHAITPGIQKILQENAEKTSALIAAALNWACPKGTCRNL
jgi:hypothetical protein